MGKRVIKTHPVKSKPIIKERDLKKFWIISSSLVIGIILLVFLINIQMVPYWFGKTDPVAKVNGQPIYSSEAKASFLVTGIAYKSFLGTSVWDQTPSDLTGLKSSVLDDLIKTHVQLQEADKEGIKLTTAEQAAAAKSYESQISTLQTNSSDELTTGLSKLSLSEATFETETKKATVNYSIIDKLKQRVLLNDYKKTLTNSDLERITVRELYIDFKSHSQDKAKKLIDEINSKLKAGAKFNDLVKEYKKDDFNSENNGLIGTIGKGIMPAEFDKVAFSLKVGEISAPVKTKLGYHIILVDKHTSGDLNNLSSDLIKDISSSDKFTKYYDAKVDEWYKKASKNKFVIDFK